MGLLMAILLTTLITWHLSVIFTYFLLRWLLRSLAEESMVTSLGGIARQVTSLTTETREQMRAAKESSS